MTVQRGVPVRIGGHDLILAFPLSAIAMIQRRLGLETLSDVLERCYRLQPENPPEGEKVDAQKWLLSINTVDFQEIVWAGLARHGGHAWFETPELVGDEMSLGDMPEILSAVAGAIALSSTRWQASPDNPDPPDPPPEAAPNSP